MTDTKLADMTVDASPTSDDLVYLVNDPGGTPGDRKVTVASLASFFSNDILPIDLTTDVTGILPQANGGIGLDTSSITNGQLLIGNSTGHVFALATITNTAGETTVSNGASTITIGIADDVIIPGIASITIPAGGTASEPTAGNGKLRYDSDTDNLMISENDYWLPARDYEDIRKYGAIASATGQEYS